MPLPSQTARVGSGRVSMASRGRASNPLRAALIALAGIGALLLAIFVLPGWWSGSGQPTPAEPVASSTPDAPSHAGDRPERAPAADTPNPTTVAEAPPVVPEPVASPAATPEPVSIVQSRRGASTPPPLPASTPVTSEPSSPSAVQPTPSPALVQAALPAELESLPAELIGLASEGYAAKQKGELVAARKLLSEALLDDRVQGTQAGTLRAAIAAMNDELIFSPRVFPSDPYAQIHSFQASDRLSKLPAQKGLAIDWRLIPRINRMSNPDRVSVGQKLKIVTGPFHARVHKDEFRMDVFMGPPEQPSEWVFVRSFTVGLGEGNSTPLGEFTVRRNSKLVNPYWVNPRTGEKFEADDPKNPIGERWIGLEGQGDAAAYSGYGIHGTIDPGSIGQMKSMGCVRLGQADVELVYELLAEGASRVFIEP